MRELLAAVFLGLWARARGYILAGLSGTAARSFVGTHANPSLKPVIERLDAVLELDGFFDAAPAA